MALFTISDLHLPLGINKPMDIFGDEWSDYVPKLKENWQNTVGKDDVVIMPGDFSWATYLEQSIADFEFLENLNGIKILLKGNHDYWWTTMNKLGEFTSSHHFDSVRFLHNNSYMYKDTAVCGCRGWTFPNNAENERIYNREALRLELSIQDALSKNPDDIIVFMHYPPVSNGNMSNIFTDIFQKYGITKCYYGHLHAKSHLYAVTGMHSGIEYSLVSSDYMQFIPIMIKE